jgi:hypothetical protein
MQPIQGLALALFTPSGLAPLSAHLPAAAIRMPVRGLATATVHGVAVGNVGMYLARVGAEGTVWDCADAVVQA